MNDKAKTPTTDTALKRQLTKENWDAMNATWYVRIEDNKFKQVKISHVGDRVSIEDIYIKCIDEKFRKFGNNKAGERPAIIGKIIS